MPRIRSIHPEACDSEKLSLVTASAERTFFRLLTHTDDDGRGEDRPKLLAAKLYPLHDDMSAATVSEDLDQLESAGLLRRYTVSGKHFYVVPTFRDWQSPKRPTPSKLPEPPPPPPEPVENDSPTCGEHVEPGGEGRGVGEERTPPGGNGEPFVKRLANELRSEHGCEFGEHDQLHDAFQALLAAALERLPEGRHHDTTMGVIADFVKRVQGYAMTTESRSHTARMVRNHSPTAVLYGYGQALDWGAGTTRDYADDPLALSKYVAGVLSGKSKRGAA